jgi:hypothetical protein
VATEPCKHEKQQHLEHDGKIINSVVQHKHLSVVLSPSRTGFELLMPR